MSFKDGIPLLATLDDEDDGSDVDFTVEERPSGTRKKWTRKHLLFAVVLAVALFVVVAVIAGVTVTVVLVQSGNTDSKVAVSFFIARAHVSIIYHLWHTFHLIYRRHHPHTSMSTEHH